jgi:integrase
MGAARKLTVKTIEAAKPRDRLYRLADGAGLYLAVLPSGSKRFNLRYKADGKDRWMGLSDEGRDTYPMLSLERARALAASITARRKAGEDPLKAKAATILERKVRLAERVAVAQGQLARLTVNALFERWVSKEVTGRKDSGAEIKRSFIKDVLPLIGTMPVESVKKVHINEVLDKVLTRGSKRMAKRLLSDMRQMFGFAIDQELMTEDPTARIKKDKTGGKTVLRDRHLSEEEIRALTAQMPDAQMLKVTEAAVWIMLATCCRVGEISRARWQDINLNAATWIIPAAHAKNGRRFVIYLSEFAKAQFQNLENLKSHAEWVFPNRKGNSHIDLKTISKQIHDRQRVVPMKNRSAKTGALSLSGGPWTPHDLRRTGATMMGNLKVPPHIIERCLNHVEQNRLTRTYQHQDFAEEQAEAWAKLGERLHLLTAAQANVVLLPARAA